MAFRDFVMWFMGSETKAQAEAESRKWIAACPNCGSETSIWDLGGLRYKAAGSPSKGFTCRNCRKFGMHSITYRA